ncbi:MAG: DinB family protein [Cyclobacteriaceae bacterium]
MKRLSFLLILFVFAFRNYAQEIPFNQMHEAPGTYSASAILERYIDGLGFRLHWATEGLQQNDYDFSPVEDGRSIRETLEHIYSLCLVIENTLRGEENIRPEKLPKLSDEELRKTALRSLERSRTLLDERFEPSTHDLVFRSGEQEFRLPFWNLINGPMEDAVYHTGQIVLMRRMNGNPIPEGVNVLTGQKQN